MFFPVVAKPFTRAQALQNRAFLKLLRKTGNVRLACRELSLKYGTMQHRRKKHRSFAVKWDAALAFASAALEKRRRRTPLPARAGARVDPPPLAGGGFRTRGGEPVVVRLKNGTVQMRRAQPGKLTQDAEQAFLAALSATCNLTLAAAAVGACFNAFNRRRKKDPAFARECRLALRRGYDALELALLEGWSPASHEHGDWRHNEPPAMPPMTVNQALQLLYLHQKEARLNSVEPHQLRRRPGESRAAQSERVAAMWEERQRRAREEFEVAEAERWARGEPAWGPAGEAARAELGLPLRDAASTSSAAPQDERNAFGLPDLAQVTGWSKADPAKAAHDETRALFGGWRLEDMALRQVQDEREELTREEWERGGG